MINMESYIQSQIALAMCEIIGSVEYGEKHAEYMAQAFKIWINRESDVLDFGAGVGRISKLLAPYCNKIYCIEKKNDNIIFGKEYCKGIKNLEWIRNDKDIPLPDNSIDFLFTFLVMQHIPINEYPKWIEEFYRVMKYEAKGFIHFQGQHWNTFIDREMGLDLLKDFRILAVLDRYSRNKIWDVYYFIQK